MLVALICNGRLAPKVNTIEEFALEAKAYKNSIKTAVHYLEHSKKSWSGQQLLLAAAQSPANMGEAHNEEEEELTEADVEDAFESNGTQEHGEEYIELEMYNNEYYTHGSDSEGLFALMEVPTGKHREKEPSNKVCMQNVQLIVAKDAMDCPVLLSRPIPWTPAHCPATPRFPKNPRRSAKLPLMPRAYFG
ncbi:hypothetical protein C0989_005147 [Termitomyces sp. Mn162]|nr:hypothetical protein C0989_005147 [Termitomyces sp. Mn162]